MSKQYNALVIKWLPTKISYVGMHVGSAYDYSSPKCDYFHRGREIVGVVASCISVSDLLHAEIPFLDQTKHGN